MTKPQLLKADGTAEDITPQKGKHFKLEELQKYVGGNIEVLYVADDMLLIINEDGKYHHLQKNFPASHKWFAMHPISDVAGDFIVGDVVYCHTSQLK